MLIGMIGDTHMDTEWTVATLNWMAERDVQDIVVLGDFGLFTQELEGHRFLDAVQATAQKYNMMVLALVGNHGDHDHRDWYIDNMPSYKGFAMIRSHIGISPRIGRFTLGRRSFFVVDGAVSIDKDWRLRNEYKPRSLYWPNEATTDEEVEDVCQWGTTDILITHDCSDHTPWHRNLVPDPDSQLNRRRIDKVIASAKPKMHFHGHMHDKYDWVNTLGTGLFGTEPEVEVQTYGLHCNRALDGASGVLDLDDMRFTFA